MNYLKRNHLSILIIVFLVASFFLGGSDKGTFGVAANVTTVGNPWTFTGAVTHSGAVTNSSTLTQTGVGTFNAQPVLNAGALHSYVNSTSTTATTYTLVAADILNYESVVITPNTGDLTLTLPASSTLSAFVPTAGDWAEQCWYNASTTAGIDITFAAGTGIDLEVASSTSGGAQSPVLTMLANSSACFKYIRKPATASAFDIIVQMTRFVDGD